MRVSSRIILLLALGFPRGGFDYFDLAGDVYVDGFDYFLAVCYPPGERLPHDYHQPGDLLVADDYLRGADFPACFLQGVVACCFV